MTDGQIQRKPTAPRRKASKAHAKLSFGPCHVQALSDRIGGPEVASPATQHDEGGGDETPSDSCRQHQEDAETADYACTLLDLARGNDRD